MNELKNKIALGIVEGRPAILGYNLTEASAQPAYFILLTWADDRVSSIRDYHYARHVMRDAHTSTL